VCDLLYDERDSEKEEPINEVVQEAYSEKRDLLITLVDDSGRYADLPDLTSIRQYAQQELASLPENLLTLRAAAQFKVVLSRGVRRRQRALQQIKEPHT